MSDRKIAARITKFERNLQQNNTKTVTLENDKERPKNRDISPEERQKFIHNFRLI